MTNNEFIEKIAKIAQKDTRILPSLTIAQAILESGWGKSGLTVKANALFGIKATSSWRGKVYSTRTKECYDGINFVDEVAAFRAYDSWDESIADHTEFLCNLSRYQAVVGEKDYKTACKAIKAAGYATDPGYTEKLISLIEKYKLYEYDTCGTSNSVETTVKSNEAKAELTHTVKSSDNMTKIARKYNTSISTIVLANKEKYPNITADYIQIGWILDIPAARTYTVKSGDTLTKIAKEYKTSIDVIISVNKKRYKNITKDYIQVGWVLIV